MSNTEQDMIQYCKGKEHIYIYGAGKNALIILQRLRANHMEVRALLVSSKIGNPESVLSVPVISVDEFQDKGDYIVLSALTEKKIIENLVRHEIRHTYFIPKEITKDMRKNAALDMYDGKYGLYEVKGNKGEICHHIFGFKRGNREYHWRVPYITCPRRYDVSGEELFPHGTILEEFENEYGTYYIYEDGKNSGNNCEKCTIYMAFCHLDKGVCKKELPEWIVPIQVGAALAEKKSEGLLDNGGENISDKNANYCECTGIYWAWKHDRDSDYIGLCHYRRHFAIQENPVYGLKDRNVDILVTSPTFVREGVKAMFLEWIAPFTSVAYDFTMKSIRDAYPDYYDSAVAVFEGRFYSPCNMFVMRRDVFDEYCGFMFAVTFGIERYYAEYDYHMRDRYMGYIAEILLNVFIVKHKRKYKIAYADMEYLQEG